MLLQVWLGKNGDKTSLKLSRRSGHLSGCQRRWRITKDGGFNIWTLRTEPRPILITEGNISEVKRGSAALLICPLLHHSCLLSLFWDYLSLFSITLPPLLLNKYRTHFKWNYHFSLPPNSQFCHFKMKQTRFTLSLCARTHVAHMSPGCSCENQLL